MTERRAVYPGSFDPITNGHLDLTRRAARLFDRVVVGVAPSPAKGTLFPVAERVAMIREVGRDMRHVEVIAFDDLLVECARRVGATTRATRPSSSVRRRVSGVSISTVRSWISGMACDGLYDTERNGYRQEVRPAVRQE